jgi:8-oxo-dGTP pyrophosphatase MutT (NUDIX family)
MKLAADKIWGWRVEATVELGDGDELDRLRSRPGEAVMVLERGDGAVWTQTKAFYPCDASGSSAFRLPTGGLEAGEDPDAGFLRELREETGIGPDCEWSRLAVVRYKGSSGASGEDEPYPFTSYMYHVPGVDCEPEPIDLSEDISGWRAVMPDDLSGVGEHLRGLADGWESWGRFRAAAHEALVAIRDRERQR